MKNVTRHEGTLEIVKRLPNSTNGNPRYLLRVDGWTCRTAVDDSFAYTIEKLDGKKVKAYIGMHYGVATLDSATIAA